MQFSVRVDRRVEHVRGAEEEFCGQFDGKYRNEQGNRQGKVSETVRWQFLDCYNPEQE